MQLGIRSDVSVSHGGSEPSRSQVNAVLQSGSSQKMRDLGPGQPKSRVLQDDPGSAGISTATSLAFLLPRFSLALPGSKQQDPYSRGGLEVPVRNSMEMPSAVNPGVLVARLRGAHFSVIASMLGLFVMISQYKYFARSGRALLALVLLGHQPENQMRRMKPLSAVGVVPEVVCR